MKRPLQKLRSDFFLECTVPPMFCNSPLQFSNIVSPSGISGILPKNADGDVAAVLMVM